MFVLVILIIYCQLYTVIFFYHMANIAGVCKVSLQNCDQKQLSCLTVIPFIIKLNWILKLKTQRKRVLQGFLSHFSIWWRWWWWYQQMFKWCEYYCTCVYVCVLLWRRCSTKTAPTCTPSHSPYWHAVWLTLLYICCSQQNGALCLLSSLGCRSQQISTVWTF